MPLASSRPRPASYVYQETLGRWHAIDLFFGLAYISRRESREYPAADIAAAGAPVCQGLGRAEAAALLEELRLLRRLMVYCQGLRHHGADAQRRHWLLGLGTGEAAGGGPRLVGGERLRRRRQD
jgi:hypothetical protein